MSAIPPSTPEDQSYLAWVASETLKGTAAIATISILNHQYGRYLTGFFHRISGSENRPTENQLQAGREENQKFAVSITPPGLVLTAGFYAIYTTAVYGSTCGFDENDYPCSVTAIGLSLCAVGGYWLKRTIKQF